VPAAMAMRLKSVSLNATERPPEYSPASTSNAREIPGFAAGVR